MYCLLLKQGLFWPQKLSYTKNHDNPSKNMEDNFKKAKRSVVSDLKSESVSDGYTRIMEQCYTSIFEMPQKERAIKL